MSEKIDIRTCLLCMTNIDKEGKITSEKGDTILGVKTKEDEFIPLTIKTDAGGVVYIGADPRRIIPANLVK